MMRAYAVSDRVKEQRVATLTAIEINPGNWIIDQIKGPYNAPVLAAVEEAADALLRSLSDAYREAILTRREMDIERSRIASTAASQAPEFDDIPF